MVVFTFTVALRTAVVLLLLVLLAAVPVLLLLLVLLVVLLLDTAATAPSELLALKFHCRAGVPDIFAVTAAIVAW